RAAVFSGALYLTDQRYAGTSPHFAQLRQRQLDIVVKDLLDQVLLVAEVVVDVGAGALERGGEIAIAHSVVAVLDQKVPRQILDLFSQRWGRLPRLPPRIPASRRSMPCLGIEGQSPVHRSTVRNDSGRYRARGALVARRGRQKAGASAARGPREQGR